MLTSTCTWVMKLMLRHGWGGGDWDVDVHLHLRHEVDAASRMGATQGQQTWPLGAFQVSCGSIGHAETFRQTRI